MSNNVPPVSTEQERRANRRSLILCGAGALIGLIIAGIGLFTAQGTRTARVPPEDAALVNGVPILMADFNAQLQSSFNVGLGSASRAQKAKVLDQMIREELYVQRGVELGAPNDDIDVRAALVTSTEGQVAQDAMTSRPTDQELRAWYDTHLANYANQGLMTVQEFIVPAGGGDPAALVAKLRGGASPASLKLKSSGRTDDGEEFYFAARVHLGDRLFAIARSLRDHQVSDPVAMPDGTHILVMVHNQPPVPASFDHSKDLVLRDFLDDKVKRLQAGNERFLRKRADIRIASALQ